MQCHRFVKEVEANSKSCLDETFLDQLSSSETCLRRYEGVFYYNLVFCYNIVFQSITDEASFLFK